MAIDFRNMQSEAQFEEMCRQLVCAEHPNAVPVEALPGDEGMDAFEGVIDEGMDHIWQFKHFPRGIGKSQQKQIQSSLKAAINRHNPRSWTLLTSTDLSPDNHRWVKKQRRDYPGTKIDVVPATRIREMLVRHQGIRKQYFPLQDEKIDVVMRMVARDTRASRPKTAILQSVQNDVAVLNDDSPHFKYTFSVDESCVRIGVEPRTPEASRMAVARMRLTFPDGDAQGEAALKRYMSEVDAGRPVVIPGQYITILESVFDQFMGNGQRISELHIIPRVPDVRLPTRVYAAHGGEEARVGYVDLRLIRRGKEELEFSNAAQTGMPFKVCLTFKGKLPGALQVWLTSPGGMRPSVVIEYERVLAIMGRPGATVTLESLSTGVTITSPIEVTSGESSEGRLMLYEDLLLIERNLDPELTLPDEITEADYLSIVGLTRALRIGMVTRCGTAKVVVVPHDRRQLRELADSGETLTWLAKDGVESFTLFGRVYEFGFESLMTGPVTILEEGLPDGGVLVGMIGDMHITYGSGRYAGPAADLERR
ncbi:MAG: hypothetical protein NT125_07420 [Candidatus Bipolaricaulota bacterium]|nr:hypothetical protein [Candidatus Bipolaricaulota bacterium]